MLLNQFIKHMIAAFIKHMIAAYKASQTAYFSNMFQPVQCSSQADVSHMKLYKSVCELLQQAYSSSHMQ